MRDSKRVFYGGNTFLVKNITPDITENERKLILQEISDDLIRVFRRSK